MKNTKPKVLVVDDDYAGLEFLVISLEILNYNVIKATCVDEAQKTILDAGIDTFDCVLTDYRMPGKSGLDLLDWLMSQDDSLSTIIATAEGEKTLVQRSLRSGAIDFLEKPVNRTLLKNAIAKGIELTAKKRSQKLLNQGIKEAGKMRQIFAGVDSTIGSLFNYFLHPLSDVGGDFINTLHLSNNKYLLILGDVSGHDIRAAFISAYFQGLMRGLCSKETPIEEIASSFNDILNKEWSTPDSSNLSATRSSLCFLSALIDLDKNNISLINCGLPEAYITYNSGNTYCHKNGYSPLGWIENEDFKSENLSTKDLSSILAFSDGALDLAQKLNVHTLSLCYYLLYTQSDSSIIKESKDDILAARFQINTSQDSSSSPHPIIFETIPGNEFQIIDIYMEKWSNSLKLIFSNKLNNLDDILMGCREVTLFSLMQICGRKSTQFTVFQLIYFSKNNTITILIEDSDYNETDLNLKQNHIQAKQEAISLITDFCHSTSVNDQTGQIILNFKLDFNTENQLLIKNDKD